MKVSRCGCGPVLVLSLKRGRDTVWDVFLLFFHFHFYLFVDVIFISC